MKNQLQSNRTNKTSSHTTKPEQNVVKHHKNTNQPLNPSSTSGCQPSKSHINNSGNHKQPFLVMVTHLYHCLFPSDDPEAQFDCDPTTNPQKYTEIEGEILEQIDRLQKKQEDLDQILRIGENKGTRLTSEDKWKMVVVSYRDKVQKLQSKLRQQKKSRQVLQQTARLQQQAKDELSHLNNIKFNKIKALVHQKQQSDLQITELNDTLQNLTQNLSQLNQTNNLLQSQLLQQSKQTQQLTIELSTIQQKTILNQQQKQILSTQIKILGNEQQQINKQITDLKNKHQIQINKLEIKIQLLQQQLQEYILIIDSLQHKSEQGFNLTSSKDSRTVDSQTQTQTLITTKACYFNSLAQQLDYDQFQYQEQQDQNASFQEGIGLGMDRDQILSQGQQEPDLFQLPLGGMSASNHLVYTDRPPKQKNNDARSQKQIPLRKSHLSFDDGQEYHSIASNSQSRHMQTMGELTSSLAEAYHKINELTEKVGELQDQNAKYEKKLKEKQKQCRKDEKKSIQSQGKGYFTSFFRK